MTRQREKDVHPFIQQIMDDRGYTTLQEFSDRTGIPARQVYQLADSPLGNRNLQLHWEAAKAMGYPLEVWVRNILFGPPTSANK